MKVRKEGRLHVLKTAPLLLMYVSVVGAAGAVDFPAVARRDQERGEGGIFSRLPPDPINRLLLRTISTSDSLDIESTYIETPTTTEGPENSIRCGMRAGGRGRRGPSTNE